MALTPEQKTALLAAVHPHAGNKKASQLINQELVGGTVVKEGETIIRTPKFLAMIPDEVVVAWDDYLNTGATIAARAMKIRFQALDGIDLSHEATRAALQSWVGDETTKITAEKCSEILAIGERPKTKADEILGRLATEADIAEARS